MTTNWIQTVPPWTDPGLTGGQGSLTPSWRGGLRPYLRDSEFLKDLDEYRIKEVFVKINVLDMQEKTISAIEGKVTAGQLNIDGASAVRRTGNLTFVPDEKEGDLTDAENIISINKKVQIDIGLTNFLKAQYPRYANNDIIWMPLGIFVITDVSMSQNLQGASISIQIQDKMCLLNGTVGGTIQSAVTLHSMDTIDAAGETVTELVSIYRIIQEVVNHFGEEDLTRILINDVPLDGKKILQWSPPVSGSQALLYKYQKATAVEDKYLSYFYTDDANYVPAIDETLQATYAEGDNIGYEYTPFVFPGELIADAGQTVCDILDKIKGVLGNFEYFYDVDGNFVFQEIKNYLNTSHATMLINETTANDYTKPIALRSKIAYDFAGGNLISSFQNTPQYSNIKNDFVVWGVRTSATGLTTPIRYHLALDRKPISLLKTPEGIWEDWRNVLYEQGVAALKTATSSNYYFRALQNEWPKLYNVIARDVNGAPIWTEDSFTWQQAYIDNPYSLDYYLDFIDTTTGLSELSIENIGRRTKVVEDKDVNCLFQPRVDDIIIIEDKSDSELPAEVQETADAIALAQTQGYAYALVPTSIYVNLTQGTRYKDAFSVVRDLLYQHTGYNTSITMQTIPIYHLDVNTRIRVYDERSGTNGEFMITSISVPIAISDSMTINAVAVLERV